MSPFTKDQIQAFMDNPVWQAIYMHMREQIETLHHLLRMQEEVELYRCQGRAQAYDDILDLPEHMLNEASSGEPEPYPEPEPETDWPEED